MPKRENEWTLFPVQHVFDIPRIVGRIVLAPSTNERKARIMPFSVTLTDEQADVIFRALANLSDDALQDMATAQNKMFKTDAIVTAIDEHNDPSEAYAKARLLAFMASEAQERIVFQRKNLSEACQEITGVINDALVASSEL
jgi:hypothetical protein